MLPFFGVAQSSATKVLKEEEGKFFRQLNQISIDTSFAHQLTRSVKVEITSIYTFLITNASLPASEKE